MTEKETQYAPAWKTEAGELGAAKAAKADQSNGWVVNADLCRAVIMEVFAYMGMELGETAQKNLESYGIEEMRELMTKFRGMLQ